MGESNNPRIRTPFPYFGGKRRIAREVWSRFGPVTTYVEPFCGSAAVWLNCPHGPRRREVLNDLDGFVANFWRAVKYDPDAVADSADHQMIEIDLHAWFNRLHEIRRDGALIERLRADPTHYDPEIAGKWAFVLCAAYGGTNRTTTRLHPTGRGLLLLARKSRQAVLDYLHGLAERLRGVAVLCADWRRAIRYAVCATKWKNATVGVFLDPPYAISTGRDQRLYVTDTRDDSISAAVRDWCIENEQHRIALCGLEGEHNVLEDRGWSVFGWRSGGGYYRPGGSTRDKATRQERVWFSPACGQELVGWDS